MSKPIFYGTDVIQMRKDSRNKTMKLKLFGVLASIDIVEVRRLFTEITI